MIAETKLARIAQNAWPITLLFCALAAGTMLFAFPMWNLWLLIVCPPLFLTLAGLGARSRRGLILAVMLTSLPLWLWVHRSFIALAWPGWILLGFYLSGWWCVIALLMRRFAIRSPRVPCVIVLPVVWVGIEFFRGSVWMYGYAWYLIAHPLIEVPMLVQSADLLGTYFVSGLAALPAAIVLDVRAMLRRGTWLPGTRFAIAGAVVVLIANLGYGWWRTQPGEHLRDGPTILAMQTNLEQTDKLGWSWEDQISDVQVFMKQTIEAVLANDGIIDLIIWPETMAPGFGFDAATMDFQADRNLIPGWYWYNEFRDLYTQLGNIPLLLGSSARLGLSVRTDRDGGQRYAAEHSYNSAYLFMDELPFQRYDKIRLTPFGETMPYISAWPWLEEQLLALGPAGMLFDLDAGEQAMQLHMPGPDGNSLTLATPICFEATVSSVCRRLVYSGDGGPLAGKADLLINISNDGWFFDVDASREAHLRIARFRCIENRVPMIRSVNTGITAWIDSVGNVIDTGMNGRRPDSREASWVLARPELDNRRSIFAVVGDVFGWLSMGGVVVLFLTTMRSGDAIEVVKEGQEG
ncbi:MAG: apolipoprotein N-acyltransferase [Phycisphaerales bacterium]